MRVVVILRQVHKSFCKNSRGFNTSGDCTSLPARKGLNSLGFVSQFAGWISQLGPLRRLGGSGPGVGRRCGGATAEVPSALVAGAADAAGIYGSPPIL